MPLRRLRPVTTLTLAALFFAPIANAQQLPNAPSTTSITGTVQDVGGTVISDAKVTLHIDDLTQTTFTDAHGHFAFNHVPATTFSLTVTEQSLAPETITGTVAPGETFTSPPIVLRIATASTEVTVTYTRQEIAEQDIHAQEQQRVLAIIPNFFVSYKPNAPPLTTKQKYKVAFRGTIDPFTFIATGIVASVLYANNDLPGYGPGFSGYAKRYGATYANSASATMLRGAVFPSLLHQDPRFFYKADGTAWAKARYALSTAVICKGDNGKWQPNYSSLLGNLSAGALTNLYYPAGSRNGASTTIENGLIATAGVGIGHLLQEFLFNHLTTHRKVNTPTQP
jgi:hypothetical protein